MWYAGVAAYWGGNHREFHMGTVVKFRHADASTGYRSGRSSYRVTPVACSIGNTNSPGTPLLERSSQYQTCDCVVPMRSASGFWPPATLQARRRASVDMAPTYPDLGKNQPKSLWTTSNLKVGRFSPMKRADRTEFARRLDRRMRALRVTQSALARVLETKQSTVKNWLEGHIPRPDVLDQLVEALSTSRDWLLYGEGSEEISGTPIDEARVNALLKKIEPAQKKFLVKMLEKMAA